MSSFAERNVPFSFIFEALPGLRRVSLAVRPTEEPESPANSMFAITFVFVIFAFVVPILLLGMKSQNTDIAGSDVPWLARAVDGSCGVSQQSQQHYII